MQASNQVLRSGCASQLQKIEATPATHLNQLAEQVGRASSHTTDLDEVIVRLEKFTSATMGYINEPPAPTGGQGDAAVRDAMIPALVNANNARESQLCRLRNLLSQLGV